MDNFVNIKEYIDTRVSELRLYSDMRCTEIEKTAAREVTVTDGRLEKLNEVREQLAMQYQQFSSQISLYLTRSEYSARHDQLIADLRRAEGQFGMYVTTEKYTHLESDMRVLSDWKANLNGRLWAIGIALGVLQILIAVMKYMFEHS